MRVVPVPCFKDNYAYLLVCESSRQAAIIDPGEAEPVIAAVRREGVSLTAIWATHHHPDHVAGVAGVVAAMPNLAVVAHASDRARVAGVTHLVDDQNEVTVGSLRAQIVFNPGHTLGAISYWLEAASAVFTGDTLFGAGCGRRFEGTAPMMHASLSRLAALPGATRVYFGHEYTAANLRFAAAVEPTSIAVAGRTAEVQRRRAAGLPSTPSTVADERATNPFLRTGEPAVVAAAQAFDAAIDPADGSAVFGALRRWKDVFQG